MKNIFFILIAIFFATTTFAQNQHAFTQEKTAVLLSGLGNYHHPVSTKNPEAQKYFDQGLNLSYAFNHEEAIRSFRKALELDPDMLMAHWGIAFALGPNFNQEIDPEREQQAYDAVQKALTLSSTENVGCRVQGRHESFDGALSG